MRRSFVGLAALMLAASLAACGGEPAAEYHGDDPLPNGMTVKEQIEARQHNLKDLGGAFKTVNDQLKTPAPQLEQIRLAAQEIRSHAQEIAHWFPAGTGPEAGVKTEALAAIWADDPGFKAAAQKLSDEASKLADMVMADDIEAIRTQAQATGGSCKGCHDKFRQRKDWRASDRSVVVAAAVAARRFSNIWSRSAVRTGRSALRDVPSPSLWRAGTRDGPRDLGICLSAATGSESRYAASPRPRGALFAGLEQEGVSLP
jgi:cytochrome c556